MDFECYNREDFEILQSRRVCWSFEQIFCALFQFFSNSDTFQIINQTILNISRVINLYLLFLYSIEIYQNQNMSQSVAESKEISSNNSSFTPCDDNDQNADDFKIGQKYPTPAPGNGDRVFYETLYKQKPSSEMAQEWCVAYGILEKDEAIKVYKQICNRKNIKIKTPNSPTPKASTNNSKPSKKQRIVVNDDVECDTGMGVGSGWEGQGSIGL